MALLGKTIFERGNDPLEADPSVFLIPLAQKGDQHAMYQLYTLYAKAMLNTAYRILNSREDAEDVLQESFIKAFGSLSSFNLESTFGAWVKRIVVNQSINHLRKRQLLVFYDTPPEPHIEPIEIVLPDQQKEKLDVLYTVLHLLPDGYRTVFSLFMLEGYDHEEIGQILGIKVSTSISQLSRAKQKLRSLITKFQNHE